MIKEKRGSIYIVLLVFMTLALCIATLFIFVTQSYKINKRFAELSMLDKIYANATKTEFYVRQSMGEAMVESYRKIVQYHEFIDSGCFEDGVPFFCSLSPDINTKFAQEFEKSFRSKISKVLQNNAFEVNFDGNTVHVKTMLLLEEKNRHARVSYLYTFNESISFRDLGLVSFSALHNIATECMANEKCWQQKLADFDSRVTRIETGSESYYKITLESKHKFFTDKTLEGVKLDFYLHG